MIYDKCTSHKYSYCNSNPYNTKQCDLNGDENSFDVDELEV